MGLRSYRLWGVLLLLALLLLWQVTATCCVASTNWPPVTDILRALAAGLANGELAQVFGSTLWRMAAGFAIGSAAGVALGIAMATFPLADAALRPLVELLRPIPMPALVPPLARFSAKALAPRVWTDHAHRVFVSRRRVRFIVPTAADGASWPTSYALTTGYETMQVEAGPLAYECNPAEAAGPFRAPGCLASGQVGTAVERDVAAGIPTEALVSSVAPNPVRGTARFSYGVPVAGRVSLALYDMLGRQVARLVDEEQAAGTYDASFDTSDLASGVYVYRLTVGGRTATRTVVVR